MKPTALLIAFLGLSACSSSPPVEFYTLEPVASSRATQVQGRHSPIQIGSVHLPGLLDRQQMVSQSAPDRLLISNQHRWGAPLDEMVQRVLAQDLALRLPNKAVVLPGAPAPPHVLILTLDILEFQPEQRDHIVLEGSWSLTPAGTDAPILSQPVHIQENVLVGDYSSQTRAMSHAIGQLADAIAASEPLRGSHPGDAGLRN